MRVINQKIKIKTTDIIRKGGGLVIREPKKIMKVNLNTLETMFLEDTKKRKANKSANQVVINCIELVREVNPNIIVDCDYSKGGNIPSRGDVAEVLMRIFLTESQQKTARKSARAYDFKLDGKKYEIKCSTSKGYAHYNPNQDLTNLVFVDGYGVHLTSGENIILDKCGKHIQTIKMNSNVRTIIEW